MYHLLIFSGAALILAAGALWRGRVPDQSGEGSEVTALEILRKEVSGVQSALMRNELEALQDAMSEVSTEIAPSVVAIKPVQDTLQPFRNVPTYGVSADGPSGITAIVVARPTGISGLLIDRDGYVLTSAGVLQHP